VLVVDDDSDAAESLMMLLEVFGHQVRVARDGPTALEMAYLDVPEVMLVDIGLPGMDGCELTRRVRRTPVLRGVLLVAFTGYGRDEDRQRTLGAGFDLHLTKPVDPAALRELLARRTRAVRP
jgi:two-component system CheB/CheR fusion protein